MQPAGISGVSADLKRTIGARSLAIAGVNMMVGSGIFVLPALVAAKLGAAAIIAYLCCGMLVFLVALCFAELGSTTKDSGGTYTYIEKAFGPYAGFLSGNIYILGAIASDAAVSNALADTLQTFFPVLRIELYRLGFQFVIFAALAWLNIRSVKNGVGFVLVTGIGKLLPLVILVGFAAPYVNADNLKWTIQPDLTNTGSAAMLLFFAFLGLEVSLCNGGEMRNPKRTVPLGLFGAVALVLALYLGIQIVSQGILGIDLAVTKATPLASVANLLWGNTGMVLIIVVGAISMLGSLGGAMLSTPRILFAAAKNSLLPQAVGKIHPKFATPHIAIIAYAAIDFLLAASGSFKQLAILSSSSLLLIYLGVVAALIKSRLSRAHPQTDSFRIPGGVSIPVLAIVVMIWLLFQSEQKELLSLGIILTVLTIIYFLIHLAKINADTMKKNKPLLVLLLFITGSGF